MIDSYFLQKYCLIIYNVSICPGCRAVRPISMYSEFVLCARRVVQLSPFAISVIRIPYGRHLKCRSPLIDEKKLFPLLLSHRNVNGVEQSSNQRRHKSCYETRCTFVHKIRLNERQRNNINSIEYCNIYNAIRTATVVNAYSFQTLRRKCRASVKRSLIR